MPAEARYRAAAASDLVRVELDALTAVYDRRSGQTHLLASPLPEMLAVLGTEEWTLAAFAAQLASVFDIDCAPAEAGAVAASAAPDTQSSGLRRSTEEVEATLVHHFGELAALGLVEVR